jgi:hypothetical protein
MNPEQSGKRKEDENMAETPGSIIDKLVTVNMKLWHQEDVVRDNISDDAIVAEAKRRINVLNGQRNRLIHELDCMIYGALKGENTFEPFDQLKDYGRAAHTGD